MKFTLQDALTHNAKFDEHGKRREILAKVETAVASTLKEAELHDEIMAYCRSKGWLAFHGSTAHKTHRTVGEPDFVIFPGDGKVICVEVKVKGGKVTPEQAGIQVWLRKLGIHSSVVWSFQEFLEAIKWIGGDVK